MSTISPQARQEWVAAVTERYQRSTPAERGRWTSSSRSPGTTASTPSES